jgi:hypothetical protein
LKKSANWLFGIGQCDLRAGVLDLRLSRLERRDRDQLCELPKVLGRCGKEELVSSAQRASQPETVEAQDARKRLAATLLMLA